MDWLDNFALGKPNTITPMGLLPNTEMENGDQIKWVPTLTMNVVCNG